MTLLLELTVNGEPRAVLAPAGETLLTVLREQLACTGAKEGCDDGECGACTVLLDGRVVTPCLVLAHQAAGREIRTIEGLRAGGGELHPLQQRLLDHGAVQCGFCTPGIVMAAIGATEAGTPATEPALRRALAGNLCRCTGYQKIFDAVLEWAVSSNDAEDSHGSAT
jgi:carbon-monoxide dehydrogenase small subunit